MRKIVIIAAILINSIPLLARNDVMERVRANLEKENLIVIEFDFTAYNAQGAMTFEQQGVFEAQQDMFRMKTPSVEVWCDTNYKWIFNKADNEIVIFKYSPSTLDITENPLFIFKEYDKDFTCSAGIELNNNRYNITLKPKDTRSPYESIELVIDKKNYRPESIVCIRRDKGVYNIVISTMNYSPKEEIERFTFDPTLYPDAFVTEMF